MSLPIAGGVELSIVTVVKLMVANALSPMLVTLAGIVMDVKFVQDSNANLPIVVN